MFVHKNQAPLVCGCVWPEILFLQPVLIHNSHHTFLSFYKVGVHIADVTHFIRPGTAIDDEAGNRGTTVYLTDKVIRTFDSIICGMT